MLSLHEVELLGRILIRLQTPSKCLKKSRCIRHFKYIKVTCTDMTRLVLLAAELPVPQQQRPRQQQQQHRGAGGRQGRGGGGPGGQTRTPR